MTKRTRTGRVAWVTGGSRGIGRACALRLADAGYHVAIGCHTRTDAAQEVQEALEEKDRHGLIVQGDMGDGATVERLHQKIKHELGEVSVLVASHGIYDRRSVHELDESAWRRTLDVNLTGAYLASRLVLPAMRQDRYGRIILLGSVRARTGSAHGAHYAAAKAALLGLVRSITLEGAGDGVTANVIAPGMIDTDILASDTPEKRRERERSVPVGRVGIPEDIAAAVEYLVSEGASYVTGTELRVDGGYAMG
jgi:3-oxoacyl-[acyl-carrier protein] reductase